MNLKEWLLEQMEPEPNSGCWLWIGGSLTEKGYARPMPDGRREYAHRLAYIAFVGPIPDGLEIDHRCRVRCCINPAHLETVPHSVNMERRFVAPLC